MIYVENVKSFFSQKSQFDLVENIKNKNKKRTRVFLSQSSEDGKQEFFLGGLMHLLRDISQMEVVAPCQNQKV